MNHDLETTQFRKVVQMRYGLKSGTLGMNIEGYGYYTSTLDSMDIDPKKIDVEELIIDKHMVTLQFASPIICNLNKDGNVTTMDCGVNLTGNSPKEFIERISVPLKSTNWDKKVEEFRKEVEARWRR